MKTPGFQGALSLLSNNAIQSTTSGDMVNVVDPMTIAWRELGCVAAISLQMPTYEKQNEKTEKIGNMLVG